MPHEFKQIPEPLQRQIFIRLGISLVSLILFTALIATTLDIYFCMPCAIAAVIFATSAFMLFRRSILYEYVVAEGACIEVNRTALKRRDRYIVLNTDTCKVKVMVRNRLRNIPVGTVVRLYVANNTPIYEKDGMQILYSYLAIEIK